MNGSLPTVKILHPDTEEGYAIINLSDLTDEAVLHDPEAEKARRKPAKEVAKDAEKAAK